MSDWSMRIGLVVIAFWLMWAMTGCSSLAPLSTVPSPLETVPAPNVQVRLTDVTAGGGTQGEVSGGGLSVSGAGRSGATGCIYTRIGTLTPEELDRLSMYTPSGCKFEPRGEVTP